MSEFLKVIPVDGQIVIHPDTFQQLPEEGMRVRRAAYWDRMESQGLVSFEVEGEEAP